MKSLLQVLAILAVAACCAGAAVVGVFPTLAPNAYSSPNWNAWQSNAVYALEHGLTAYGDPSSPSYYRQGGSYNSAQVVVTGFPSWMGQVAPGTVFGAAYANEFGNRMTFGLVIDGEGTQFSISQLSFAATSNDPTDSLAFAFPDGYQYSDGYVGVRVGGDGLLGTADDVTITSGPDTQLVDYLFGRGSGNSFAAYCSPCTDAEQAAALWDAAGYPGTPLQFTATYTLKLPNGGQVSGSGTFDIEPVPEPAAAWLFGSGLLGLVAAVRRRRALRR